MNYDSYMNPMFSDMDNKYIYPMPYVNPMVYMNPYMMNQMPNQPQQQCGVENQQESYQNPYQGNPMMYMNPYLMNPMMGNMDPNMMMQMMMQMMQMMNCMPGMIPPGCMGIDTSMMNPDMNTNPYNDPMQNMPGMMPGSMGMIGCMPGMMPFPGMMPGMPPINMEELDEEEM